MSAMPNGKHSRRQMIVAIVTTWKKLRPDLAHDAAELRASRLEFASKLLGAEPIASLTDLNGAQLGRVLDRLREQENRGGDRETGRGGERFRGNSSRRLAPSPVAGRSSAVVHLASGAQIWAIEKILDYLGWSEEGCLGFFRRNFDRDNPRMLKAKGKKSADSAITILLTMAASRDIKKREGEVTKVSREMVNAELPALKKRIGLGSKE